MSTRLKTPTQSVQASAGGSPSYGTGASESATAKKQRETLNPRCGGSPLMETAPLKLPTSRRSRPSPDATTASNGSRTSADWMKWLAPLRRADGVTVAHVVPRSTAHEKEPAMEHCAIDLGGRKSQVC